MLKNNFFIEVVVNVHTKMFGTKENKNYRNIPQHAEVITLILFVQYILWRSSPGAFLEKVVLNICSKFTGQHLCQSVISINFLDVTLCSPVNLLHIFRTPFYNNTSGGMFQHFVKEVERKKIVIKLWELEIRSIMLNLIPQKKFPLLKFLFQITDI